MGAIGCSFSAEALGMDLGHRVGPTGHTQQAAPSSIMPWQFRSRFPSYSIDRCSYTVSRRCLCRRDVFHRHRAHREGRDVDAINWRNDKFNSRLDRAYGEYSKETKANLERGTALPDN